MFRYRFLKIYININFFTYVRDGNQWNLIDTDLARDKARALNEQRKWQHDPKYEKVEASLDLFKNKIKEYTVALDEKIRNEKDYIRKMYLTDKRKKLDSTVIGGILYPDGKERKDLFNWLKRKLKPIISLDLASPIEEEN